jgi:hypothetical protein
MSILENELMPCHMQCMINVLVNAHEVLPTQKYNPVLYLIFKPTYAQNLQAFKKCKVQIFDELTKENKKYNDWHVIGHN